MPSLWNGALIALLQYVILLLLLLQTKTRDPTAFAAQSCASREPFSSKIVLEELVGELEISLSTVHPVVKISLVLTKYIWLGTLTKCSHSRRSDTCLAQIPLL